MTVDTPWMFTGGPAKNVDTANNRSWSWVPFKLKMKKTIPTNALLFMNNYQVSQIVMCKPRQLYVILRLIYVLYLPSRGLVLNTDLICRTTVAIFGIVLTEIF